MPVSAEEIATRAVAPKASHDGQVETISGREFRHRFARAPGAVSDVDWHLVCGGKETSQIVVLVHGHPMSWRYFAPIMPELAADFQVVAIDLKGYGQSDKRPGDWRPQAVSEELLALLDLLEADRFDLVASDRGTLVTDVLAARHPGRVRRYVRLGAPHPDEIEGHHHYESWHKDPLYAENSLRDASRYLAAVLRPQLAQPIGPSGWAEIVSEFSHDGIARAAPRYFQSASFSDDQKRREKYLFDTFSGPVLSIRGDGAHRYEKLAGTFSSMDNGKWSIERVEGAGIYLLIDKPEETSKKILDFLTDDIQDNAGASADKATPAFVPTKASLPDGYAIVKNVDGEREAIGKNQVTHRFVVGRGEHQEVNWHYVEAGDRSNPTIVMLHGHPESWFGLRHQIDHFADRFHVIAPDLKGYGQSEKRPGEFRHEHVAQELVNLIDDLGIDRFSLVAHDRGAVQADYIGGNNPHRVVRYVRMQQIGHVFTPVNSPQELIFQDPTVGPKLFSNPVAIFDRMWARFKMEPIAEEVRNRMISEVSHDGFSDAVVCYFQQSSFQKELYDRTLRLFPAMDFPVLFLQAGADLGQPAWYFDDPARPVTDYLPDAEVEFVKDAGHFTTVNHPALLTEAIDRFFIKTQHRG